MLFQYIELDRVPKCFRHLATFRSRPHSVRNYRPGNVTPAAIETQASTPREHRKYVFTYEMESGPEPFKAHALSRSSFPNPIAVM
jgi:hypothetical protein